MNSSVIRLVIQAPMVAGKCEPGQFIMLRVDETGERIPITIADYDRSKGTITIIVQVLGKTTWLLKAKQAGEYLVDIVGPLGYPSHLEGYKTAAVVGGGLGCAIAYPQAKRLRELGTKVDVIAGFRNKDLIILEKEMGAVADRLGIVTDDGSNGSKGMVTDKLRQFIDQGRQYDVVIAIGPLIMMKFVAQLTKGLGIKTLVSMNPIMIDGTGMCGCCRVTVGGKTKFACVDGPDFDGHEVDYDEAIRRSKAYLAQEETALKDHLCRLEAMANG
ncbi:MAG: sulfide/dihydroorotate dehydrogenase-like FAD/NAD-binding protein [Syntrophomonadaceae bacterium]|nr:sulfide/dihydroorotate dehydrogenase-like FAD/NAD-binding protein [Syntrophomonadaceae bacterium]